MADVFNYLLVKQALKERGATYQDLADFLTDKGMVTVLDTVKTWFRNDEKRRSAPELPRIKLIAEYLKKSFDEIMIGYSTSTLKQTPLMRVPIVGSASCGVPELNAYQDVDTYTYCPADEWNEEMYSVIANGSSMEPDIEEGDELLCDPKATVMDGDIVHYSIDGEGAVKVYAVVPLKNKFCFIPINDKFPTKEFDDTPETREKLRIVKVIKFNRSLENGRKARLRGLGF